MDDYITQTPKSNKRSRSEQINSNKQGGKKDSTPNKDKTITTNTNRDELSISTTPKRISGCRSKDGGLCDDTNAIQENSDIAYNEMIASDIIMEGNRQIENIDKLRANAKNLRGKASGNMRKGLYGLKEIIKAMGHSLLREQMHKTRGRK